MLICYMCRCRNGLKRFAFILNHLTGSLISALANCFALVNLYWAIMRPSLFFKNDETCFKACTLFAGIVLIKGRFAGPLERGAVSGQDHIAARYDFNAH